MSLKDGFLRLNILSYSKPKNTAPDDKQFVLPLWELCVALTAWMMVGCGTPHSTLQFSAPANITAGTPFTVTVTVLYQGKPDTIINGPIHFTSSDPTAVLPANYIFTPSDAGSHTWTNESVLRTPGTQTISGYIFLTSNVNQGSGINGSTKITVSPAVSR